jgi:acetyl-CoA carboxylase carboxyltransferase component
MSFMDPATGEKISPEELGGVKLHTEETGLADAAGRTEDECLALVRRFLSYLPSHHRQAPPAAEVPAGSGAEMGTIADLVPEARNRAYDMTRVLRRLADGGEIFEVKERFGRSVVTALARMGGHVVGFVANQPIQKGGACDADGCDKATSFLALCDSFNIPLVFLHDIPGFFIGRDAERRASRPRSSPGWRPWAWSRCRGCRSSCARPTARPTSTWAAGATRTSCSRGPPPRCRSWTRPPG